MKTNSNMIQKLTRLRLTIKRMFPKLRTEIALFVAILSLMYFAANIINTATIGQEQSEINATIDSVQGSPNPDNIHQSDFEINGTGQLNITTQVIEYPSSQMCFIGDSRTVGMQNAVFTDAYFIAKTSMGLDWFNNTASVEFEKIKDNVGLCVVALGINDIGNGDAYIARLNEFAEQYPDKVFIYANLGPVDESKYTTIPNSTLEEFNKKMQQGLSDRWQIVDQYTYLAAEGFHAEDGLHYSLQDSAKIFTWIVNTVKNQTIEIVVEN